MFVVLFCDYIASRNARRGAASGNGLARSLLGFADCLANMRRFHALQRAAHACERDAPERAASLRARALSLFGS